MFYTYQEDSWFEIVMATFSSTLLLHLIVILAGLVQESGWYNHSYHPDVAWSSMMMLLVSLSLSYTGVNKGQYINNGTFNLVHDSERTLHS